MMECLPPAASQRVKENASEEKGSFTSTASLPHPSISISTSPQVNLIQTSPTMNTLHCQCRDFPGNNRTIDTFTPYKQNITTEASHVRPSGIPYTLSAEPTASAQDDAGHTWPLYIAEVMVAQGDVLARGQTAATRAEAYRSLYSVVQVLPKGWEVDVGLLPVKWEDVVDFAEEVEWDFVTRCSGCGKLRDGDDESMEFGGPVFREMGEGVEVEPGGSRVVGEDAVGQDEDGGEWDAMMQVEEDGGAWSAGV